MTPNSLICAAATRPCPMRRNNTIRIQRTDILPTLFTSYSGRINNDVISKWFLLGVPLVWCVLLFPSCTSCIVTQFILLLIARVQGTAKTRARISERYRNDVIAIAKSGSRCNWVLKFDLASYLNTGAEIIIYHNGRIRQVAAVAIYRWLAILICTATILHSACTENVSLSDMNSKHSKYH